MLGVNRKLQWKLFGQARIRQTWDATIAGGGFTHCTVMAAPASQGPGVVGGPGLELSV